MHVIEIDREDTRLPVGLALNFGDGTYLRVVKVQDKGLIMKWNLSNPTQLVRRGDRIIDVNGVRGNAEAMTRACESDKVKMVICRTADFEQRQALLQRSDLSPQDYELLSTLDTLCQATSATRDAQVRASLPRKLAADVVSTMCVVCLTDFAPDSEVAELSCKHAFCPECIGRWVSNHRPQCPICKRSIISRIDGPHAERKGGESADAVVEMDSADNGWESYFYCY